MPCDWVKNPNDLPIYLNVVQTHTFALESASADLEFFHAVLLLLIGQNATERKTSEPACVWRTKRKVLPFPLRSTVVHTFESPPMRMDWPGFRLAVRLSFVMLFLLLMWSV
jgi:hypothetical protein